MSGATRGRINRPIWSFLPVLGLNALVGMPVYLVAFLIAYYKEPNCYDDVCHEDTPIGWSDHMTFLAQVAVFAVLCGLIVLFSAAWEPEAMVGQLFAFGILSSLALNATVVGVGSIVSATHKNQGSVSVNFSTSTGVLVAVALLGFAAACAFAADAVRRSEL